MKELSYISTDVRWRELRLQALAHAITCEMMEDEPDRRRIRDWSLELYGHALWLDVRGDNNTGVVS